MNTVLRGNWNYPTTIWAGPGRISELPAACARAGMRRPLLVTDEGLAKAPMIANALGTLEYAAVFSAVRGNPAASHVDAGLRAYRAGRHDGVVAFGGGSALDVGKVVAFMSGQTRSLWDFEDIGDWWTRADPAGIAPVVAVPTTAGTGSEVGRAGVIVNEETHQKKIIFHPQMMPRVVISDAPPPALTPSSTVSKRTARRDFIRSRTASHSRACASFTASCPGPAPTAATSRRAHKCWPRPPWVRPHSRRGWAGCMP